ncbi:MAG: T9SS type A sorting domain-containing protein [Ignavibacteriae bacterium]|nr:T9SS type A sorting domain-containing protein [Ignavibacteriota bacterium]
MSYGTTAAAYTGAERGFPLGDLNWYPELKSLWESGGTVAVEQISNNIPKNFSLEQNYPNPFNPTTNIQFSIPVAGKYTLKVYNLLGQEVANLLNQQVAAGTHNVTFDATELTSGVYAYSISGNNFNQTKKMILIK